MRNCRLANNYHSDGKYKTLTELEFDIKAIVCSFRTLSGMRDVEMRERVRNEAVFS